MVTMVGASVVRKEDESLMTGNAKYVDSVRLPGEAVMHFVRSTEAHARIVSVDTSAAAASPGVLAVYTAEDFSDYGNLPGIPGMDRPMLASGVVRFAGEGVALVVGVDHPSAADAAALVNVDYETLPAVTTPTEAMAEGAPVLHEEIGSNVLCDIPCPDALESLFSEAPRTASLRLWNNRLHPVPMETSVVLADWNAGKLTIWASTQVPHALRNTLSNFLGIPQSRCRVIQPDVGGGFGAKVQWYPELMLAPIVSKRLGRPVKYVQTRTECFLAMYPGRDQHHEVEVAFDEDGKILGIRSDVIADCGGYPDVPVALGMPTLTNWMSSGCYAIESIAASNKVVATNKTPYSSYRGAGRPEAAYLIERVVDLVADETGLDPVDVRFANFIPAEDFPYKVPHAEVYYDSGDYRAALEKLLEISDYGALTAERDRRRADPDEKLMGIGLSTWVEIASFGPRGSMEAFGHIGSYESSQVRIQPDGTAVVNTGAAPHGQGTVTILSQIAADELQIPFENIVVRYGDTETTPQGVGTVGSRTAAIAGESTKQASQKVMNTARRIAAHLLEANPDDVVCEEGQFSVVGTPEKTVGWDEVGWAGLSPTQLPDDLETGCLEATAYFEPSGFTFPFGAYLCVVGIDRETGGVEIEQFLTVDDCGTVLNPLLADGQVQGGIVQGIAQALYEEMRYDSSGQPLTANLMDYLMPAASDVPSIVSGHTVTITPHNSLGAKGIGEAGSIGAPPAVINAVVDALSHFGVRHIDMPAAPEKIWRAMQDA